jgi:hypothetical protein
MSEYKPNGHPPHGYESSCEPNEHGWAIWKPTETGSTCPNCDAKPAETEEGELMALQCPECESPGCVECFLDGRGNVCPECQDEEGDW